MRDLDDLIAERARTHGNFVVGAQSAATLQAFVINRASHLGAPEKFALVMIATKIARILHGDAGCVDHWDDIAGYATLVGDHIAASRAPGSAPDAG